MNGCNPQERYEAYYGPNTKQWWAYDNETDEYCDPPLRILEEIKAHSSDISEQEAYFTREILAKNPKWLYDEDYRFADLDI